MKKLLLSAAALLTLVVPLTFSAVSSADTSNFVINDFYADETLTNADKQGELHVVEHIKLTYNDQNHGILRSLPDRYKKHSLQLHINSVSSDTGAPAKYTTYSSNDNTVLKIGDANQTVTGPQEYTIDYTLRNVITFYPDHDELYWDVNGDQWQQPFESVRVAVRLPSDAKQSRQPVCYVGSYGSTSQNCTIAVNGTTIAAAASGLENAQTLSYVVGFDKNYFKPSTWQDTVSEYISYADIVKFLVPLLAVGGSSLFLYYKSGRDAKGTGIIVPQYDAPDGMSPLEVGTLVDFKVDNRDITATIIDLAVRGYLKIIESDKKHLIGKDSIEYSLQLNNADFSSLNAYEQLLMTALFPVPAIGQVVDINALKNKLFTTASTLRAQVEANLTTNGYFKTNPIKTGVSISIVMGVAFFGLFLFKNIVGLAFALGIILGTVIAAIVAANMAARTAKGVAANEHALGLKLFLNVTEKERLAKLQAPNAQYATASGEPVKTVELFEKLLPYAMVLSVEKQWAKQFDGLYNTPPNWYAGNWSTFNAYYLATSLNDGIGSAVNSAFSSPASSGGSGFGGGGAGGGGGGGGGGGW